jgi:ArsR family transcriptional regulator, cadmium/lead-responsive transcriptional repressor
MTSAVELVLERNRAYAEDFTQPGLPIMVSVRGGARSVTEIVDATGLTQSNVSNHLACLLDCDLVAREQRGRFAIYELPDRRVEALLAGVDDILTDVANGVYVCPRYEAEA